MEISASKGSAQNSAFSLSTKKSEADDKDESYKSIQWVELIFLPFNDVFQLFSLITAILKCYLGPLTSTYPTIYCKQQAWEWYFQYPLYYYMLFSDIFYILDTFLHILHRCPEFTVNKNIEVFLFLRQVEDESRKREHMPKSAFLILVDIVSLFPLFKIALPVNCPPSRLWPNILGFTETLLIYRVVQYFQLGITHSLCSLILGYGITSLLLINAVACFFLMATYQGLCKLCHKEKYDWRSEFSRKYKEFDNSTALQYLHGFQYVISYLSNRIPDLLFPKTKTGYYFTNILMIMNYYIWTFILVPKFFAEAMFKLKHISTFNVRAKRIIGETEWRNPTPTAHLDVEKYYSILWNYWNGITKLPDIIASLPRHLSLSIKQDLMWAVFYHSPTFRKTSMPYKRFLCEHVHLEYKLAGERFFSGLQCYTHLYYIKSGVVQFFSSDDAISPILTVTSGTIFGDISFIIPPYNRRVIVRCLTHCEVFVVSRQSILMSLHKFPEDRRHIMKNVKKRLNHAQTLFMCKKPYKGQDTTIDEGVAWIKLNWWEISSTIAHYKRSKKQNEECQIREKISTYHCAKYLGQLVLCPSSQLQSKSMFVSDKFPWMLSPQSLFFKVWNSLVYITVWVAVFIIPPNTARLIIFKEPLWYTYVSSSIDVVFAIDVIVMLFIAVDDRDNPAKTLSSVATYRFKNIYFILDILSTFIFDKFVKTLGTIKFYQLFVFNRLLKSYLIFVKRTPEQWTRKHDPEYKVFQDIFVWHILIIYVGGYFLFIFSSIFPEFAIPHLFHYHCIFTNYKFPCTFRENGILSVALAHFYRVWYMCGATNFIKGKSAILIEMFYLAVVYFVRLYTKTYYLAYLYFKYETKISYQHYVSRIGHHFKRQNINSDLMKRLERYLLCHWRYNKGIAILHQNPLKDESFNVYWKYHGEIAEKTIGETKLLRALDPGLVRELAKKAKFLLLPRRCTLLLFGVDVYRANFLLKGHLKCEYQNDMDESIEIDVTPGTILSVAAVIFGGPSIRTYTAATDCEILYVNRDDFLTTLKRYPNDNECFQKCVKEFAPKYMSLLEEHVLRYRDYQQELRHKLFHSTVPPLTENTFLIFFKNYRSDPESAVIRYWMMLRVFVLVMDLTHCSLKSALIIGDWQSLQHLFNVVSTTDMVLKAFLPYYDSNGIVISAKKECILRYLTRTFITDVIGTFRIYMSLEGFFTVNRYNDMSRLFSKFVRIYIIIGWFNYYADSPNGNRPWIMVLKWLIVFTLMTLAIASYLSGLCILTGVGSVQTVFNRKCWFPRFLTVKSINLSQDDINLIYANAITFAQHLCTKVASRIWTIQDDIEIIRLMILFIILGFMFWWITCHCQVLLALDYGGGSTTFLHQVNQLRTFLASERVGDELIKNVLDYFSYIWVRTNGLDIKCLMQGHIGVVFRQDLSYYLYGDVFKLTAELLGGGDVLERRLATHVTEMYFVEGQDIMREMDLATNLFLVNRGRVTITKNGETIAFLTKGSIFGQLIGSKTRPINCSAQASEKTDVLVISVKEFHSIITTSIRKTISASFQAKEDYMSVTKPIIEDPYDSIEYIMRGEKVLKLPKRFMTYRVEKSTSNWYYRWLLFSWYFVPVATTILVLLKGIFYEPRHLYDEQNVQIHTNILHLLIILDILYALYWTTNLFSMELTVVDGRCEYKQNWRKKLKNAWYYVDFIFFFLPFGVFKSNIWQFHFARLIRVRLLNDFYKHFCKSLKARYFPLLLRCTILFLILHTVVCSWIILICRYGYFESAAIPRDEEKTYDPSIYAHSSVKKGCARLTTVRYKLVKRRLIWYIGFIAAADWKIEYVMITTTIIALFCKINLDMVVPKVTNFILVRNIIQMILIMLDMYLSSVAIAIAYRKFRDAYFYDYRVSLLLTYLKQNGLSKILINSIRKYSTHLWQRQNGCWLPEITLQAPQCMREDIMVALYMHHLRTPTLFDELPFHFLRQLATRLNRIVVYPGKAIVLEGDVYPCMFFIHEGEVERWYTDGSGESRLSTVLTINRYFGLIPGLFPNTSYQFSYYARTVVDLVYLNFDSWQDLLNGYAEIKYNLYRAAFQLKKENIPGI